MHIDKFKHDFKRLNGVYATDTVILLRKPLELYNLATGKTIATFDSLGEALRFEIDGKTLEQRVADWTEIVFPMEHGGRGSGSGMGFSGKWPTFSKEDVINTAMGTRRGIVAVSTKEGRGEESAKYAGTYSFVKGGHFNASAFIKGVNSAKLSGKDYNDAVSRWLKANQKKYGYTYSFTKAR